MSENVTQKFLLYFFWAFLDDKKALESAISSKKLYVSILSQAKGKLNQEVTIIKAIHQVWTKNHHKFIRSKAKINSEFGWSISRDVNLFKWNQFLKISSPDEIEVTILIKILNFNILSVVEALELPEGTIRYRLSKSYTKLMSIDPNITYHRSKKMSADHER